MTIRWLDLFLDRPRGQVDEAARFWAAVTRTTLSPWRDGHTFATLVPAGGDAYLRIQGVDELAPGGGAHVDVEVDDVVAERERAVGLGAAVLSVEEGLVVLRSPAGLPFCLSRWAGARTRPAPVGSPPARVDQLTLDIPAARYAAESGFWTALTGWGRHRGSLVEFEVLRPDGWGDGSPGELPTRILLQQTGAGHAGMHLDLSAADRAATTRAHEALGARIVVVRPAWTVLRDPVGGVYCITDRDPLTGSLAAS